MVRNQSRTQQPKVAVLEGAVTEPVYSYAVTDEEVSSDAQPYHAVKSPQ